MRPFILPSIWAFPMRDQIGDCHQAPPQTICTKVMGGPTTSKWSGPRFPSARSYRRSVCLIVLTRKQSDCHFKGGWGVFRFRKKMVESFVQTWHISLVPQLDCSLTSDRIGLVICFQITETIWSNKNSIWSRKQSELGRGWSPWDGSFCTNLTVITQTIRHWECSKRSMFHSKKIKRYETPY